MWLKYSFLVMALNERTIQVLNDKGVSQENIDFIETIDEHLQGKLVGFLISNPNATMDQLISFANSFSKQKEINTSSITNYISSSTLEPTFANWLQAISESLAKRNPELQATELPQQWKTVFNGINDWVHSKVSRDPSFVLSKDHSFEDIKRLSDEWHSQFKTDDATVLQRIPETTVYSPKRWNGWYIEYLVGQLAHDAESDAMNNCTRQYGKESAKDELYIFSLRDADGKSHATIGYFADGDLKEKSGIGNAQIEPEAAAKIKEWRKEFGLKDSSKCEVYLKMLSSVKIAIANAVSNGITGDNIKYVPYLSFEYKIEICKNNPILLKLFIKNKMLSINEAIDERDNEAIELLIANGAQPNNSEKNNNTLESAIGTEDRWIIERMLDIGAKPNKYTYNNAIKNKDQWLIERMTEAGAKPNEDTLNCAIIEEDQMLIERMIELEAEPNEDTLNYTVFSKDKWIIERMIELGAKPNEDTLNHAIRTKDHWIIENVIKAGAIPGVNTLYYAIETKDHWIIEKMIESGAKLNEYILDLVIEIKDKWIIERMIELGVKPDAFTLFYAIQTKNKWIINRMIELGAKPNENTLYYAINTKDNWIIERIKRLIETGK
jgi:hypothetical protein